MQLDSRRGQLRSVEVGRSIFLVMTVYWVNQGCVDPVAGSYGGSYVSQVLQW